MLLFECRIDKCRLFVPEAVGWLVLIFFIETFISTVYIHGFKIFYNSLTKK